MDEAKVREKPSGCVTKSITRLPADLSITHAQNTIPENVLPTTSGTKLEVKQKIKQPRVCLFTLFPYLNYMIAHCSWCESYSSGSNRSSCATFSPVYIPRKNQPLVPDGEFAKTNRNLHFSHPWPAVSLVPLVHHEPELPEYSTTFSCLAFAVRAETNRQQRMLVINQNDDKGHAGAWLTMITGSWLLAT